MKDCALNLKTVAATGISATEVVQTIESASVMPRTAVPFVPAKKLQLALNVSTVVVSAVAAKKLSVFEESTAVKYFGVTAMVILPPTGMAVTVVKPISNAIELAEFGVKHLLLYI